MRPARSVASTAAGAGGEDKREGDDERREGIAMAALDKAWREILDSVGELPLLRRSRSTGIGVLLATQNPGDFDYMARDNINTWLLGKITQDRAIEKMKNVIGNYPDVGPRLASQRTGSFFVLTGTTKRELKADRSLMETMQSSESEVAELARATRPAPPRK